MNPPPLRPESVQRRLAEMTILLDVLTRHVEVTGDELGADIERRLVVERALTQLVDLAAKVNAHVATAMGQPTPADYHGSFAAAAAAGLISAELAQRLAPSAGLRNRLIHQYESIDLDRVAAAVATAVTGYRAYVTGAARWLQRRAGG